MTVIINSRSKSSEKSLLEAKETLCNIKIIENEIKTIRNSLIEPAINHNPADKMDNTTQFSAQIASSQSDDKYSKFVGEALLATEKKDYHSALEAWEKAKEIRKTNFAFYGVGLNKYRISKTEEDPVKKKKLLNESIDNYKKLLFIDQTKSYFAYNQWGNSLVELSSVESDKKKIIELLDSAIDKYSHALKHEQNENELYNNYGNALLLKAKNTDAQEEKKQLIHTAHKLFLKAESLLTGSASYNIACAYILEGIIDEAKKWLNNAKETFFLPDCDHLRTDTDLDPVRNEQWFKDFLAEVCPEE